MSAAAREDRSIDTLLAAYLRCLDEADRVPVFSVLLYLRLAWWLWLWEVALLALFFVPLLDLALLCLRPFTRWRPPSPTRWVWRYLGRPFRALWRGDISGLQVVRVRILTRTFLGAHIAGVTDRLKLRADRTRLLLLLGPTARAEALAALEAEQKKLDALANLARATNAAGAVIATGSASALPLALAKLLIPLLVRYLPQDVNDQIAAMLPLGQVLKTIGLAGDETIALTPTLIALAGGFLCFLLLTAMSCHIEKRRIMQQAGAEAAEKAVLQPPVTMPAELPLDVVFAAGAAVAGFLTMYLYANLALAEPDRSTQMATALWDLGFCLALATLVAARRSWLRLLPEDVTSNPIAALLAWRRAWRRRVGLR